MRGNKHPSRVLIKNKGADGRSFVLYVGNRCYYGAMFLRAIRNNTPAKAARARTAECNSAMYYFAITF